MNITILHDRNCAASRDFIIALGVTIPEGDDVTVAIGPDTVRIVSDHATAVALCPAFPGYPVALIGDDEERRMLVFPASWDAVTAWAANPAPVAAKSTMLTKYAFSQRFHSDEMIGILALRLTDPVVGLFLQLMDYAQEIDLTDVNIQSGIEYLVSIGKLTQDRATAILTP